MCGIAGVVTRDPGADLVGTARRMLDSITHRGPDDGGLFSLPGWGVAGGEVSLQGAGACPSVLAMGNRRLSILDLTAAGHQPFSDREGRVWIVYNGETYNYVELRSELAALGHSFVSGTDTEVVLHSYLQWGLDCFPRLNGMWAMAIWDSVQRRLVLARDHFGIKPLYYAMTPTRLAFGSEIRAIREAIPADQVSLSAVRSFLLDKLVDSGEETFYQGVRRLTAASYMVVDLSHPEQPWSSRKVSFWNLDTPVLCEDPPADRSARVRSLLEDSIRLRLRSDVPVGVCLSGGLDSSSIVVLLKRLLEESRVNAEVVGPAVKTFTAFYPSEKWDEKPYVDELLRHSRLEAYSTSPSGNDVHDVLRQVIACQEEPFGGTGIISQWFVFRLARQHGMKVMLDGQGADELFGGYLTFFYPLLREYRRSGQYLQLASELVAAAWHHSYYRSLSFRLLGKQRTAVFARFGNGGSNGRGMTGIRTAALPAQASSPPSAQGDRGSLRSALKGYLQKYSLPSLLRFEDKNSMHFSIESRLPFLDPRLVEYAFSLPPESLIHLGTTKKVLRQAMQDALPRMITDRRLKLGFSTPEAAWLRGALRPVFTELFDSASFAGRGFFDVPVVQREWKQFCEGANLDPGQFWRWGNLELWFRESMDHR